MREIKFRAWDKLNGEQVMLSHQACLNRGLRVENLMQYTGLKDKNGLEIYEGDVVIKHGIDDNPYTVKYGEQSISHDWLGIGFYCDDGEINNIFGGEYIEIIGNIYENPELIK